MTETTGWLFDGANLPCLDRASEETSKRRHRMALQGSRELEMGRAAEHLVCADLLLSGWVACPTAQGMPYDIVVDAGHRLIRVQVKSTYYPKNPQPKTRMSQGYFFYTRRAGRGGSRLYRLNEFDVYALVGLDRRLIAYFAAAELPKQCVVLRVPGAPYGPGPTAVRGFEGATFDRALMRSQNIAAANDFAAAA